jgi:hypothetical protein
MATLTVLTGDNQNYRSRVASFVNVTEQVRAFHPGSEVGGHESFLTVKVILHDTEPSW